MVGKKVVSHALGPGRATGKSTGELIAAANAEVEAAEDAPLSDVRIRVREVGGRLEMHILASARYGLSCPEVAARLRRRILSRIGDDIEAVHFFVRKLVTGQSATEDSEDGTDAERDRRDADARPGRP